MFVILNCHESKKSEIASLMFIRALLNFGLVIAVQVAVFVSTATNSNAAAFHKNQLDKVQNTLPRLVQPVAVFGEDTRKNLPDKYKYLKKYVGLLQHRKGRSFYSCTAFCIAPDIIGTAAHCLYLPDKRGRRRNLSNFTFKVGKGSSAVQSKISSDKQKSKNWSIVAGTTFPERGNLYNFPYDWALIKLARPICRAGNLEISPKPLSELIEASRNNRIFNITYQKFGKRYLYRYTGDCPIRKNFEGASWEHYSKIYTNPNNMVPHKCDYTPGGSGSPLLLETPTHPVVIAIQSGGHFKLRKTKKKSGKKAKVYVSNRAISALAFSKKIDLLRGEFSVPSVELLKEIQKLLKETGDYKGGIDGIYGRGMRQAILDFERRYKLPVTGRPTESVISKLRSNGTKSVPEKSIMAFESYLYSPRFKDFKAFAVDPKTGRGGRGWGNRWHPRVAISRALKFCENKNKNCKLVAVGDTIVTDMPEQELDSVIEKYMAKIAKSNGLAPPVQEYLRAKKFTDFKAFAYNPTNGRWQRHRGYSSPTAAVEVAISRCSKFGTGCKLYAVGNTIVMGKSKEEISEIIDAYKKSVAEKKDSHGI